MRNALFGPTASCLLLFVTATLGVVPTAWAEELPADTAAKKKHDFPWERDWNKARARAKAEAKDLFINFTGSDWCHWCVQLDEEVFSKSDFAKKAGKHFVFVFLDFPNSPALKERVVDPKLSMELRERYAVGDFFPTVILANAEGRMWGKTGYQSGGDELYLEHLELMKANREAVLALDENTVTIAKLKAGIVALQNNRLLQSAEFHWVHGKAKALDPDGQHGVRIYIDRLEERNAFRAALPRQRGEVPNWAKIYEFIKGARYLDADPDFLDTAIVVVQALLIPEKRFDEATALATRIRDTRAIQGNERLRKGLEGLLAKIAKDKQAAAEEEAKGGMMDDDTKGGAPKSGGGDK